MLQQLARRGAVVRARVRSSTDTARLPNASATVCVIAVVATLLGVPTSAQSPQFKSHAAAVRVDALVTDGRRLVAGLTARDFELRDNGVIQTITDVDYETLPLNIISVLDVSSSVAGAPLGHLKKAYLAVIDALARDDRAALISFANRIELHSGLTGDRVRLRALADRVQSGGATSVIDATLAALALREAEEGRTLVLLLSDGRDTSSWLTARKLVQAARRTDVVLYPVTVREARPLFTRSGRPTSQQSAGPSERLLDALAEETGGRVVYASDEAALARTFLDVLKEFRQRYVLSYSPSGVSSTGWHTIEVKLRGKSGDVRARRGYFAK
jgi:VWFA-related protein